MIAPMASTAFPRHSAWWVRSRSRAPCTCCLSARWSGCCLLFHLHGVAAAGVVLVTVLLLYEHSLVSPQDLSRMNAAFFTLNGIISVVYFASVAADVLLLHT